MGNGVRTQRRARRPSVRRSAVFPSLPRFGGGLPTGESAAAAIGGLERAIAVAALAFGSTADIHGDFSSYIASFEGPPIADEPAFERQLWMTLQRLHDVDAPHHAWDARVSPDPRNPQFSFSFARTAFFIVGLHAASSRATRRFAWPTLVFNPHHQFDSLKAQGRYNRFRSVIRAADKALQGDLNPMLTDFGDRSEAAQYSGRRVDESWECPFHPHGASTDDSETS